MSLNTAVSNFLYSQYGAVFIVSWESFRKRPSIPYTSNDRYENLLSGQLPQKKFSANTFFSSRGFPLIITRASTVPIDQSLITN